jgi:hypothetical protein
VTALATSDAGSSSGSDGGQRPQTQANAADEDGDWLTFKNGAPRWGKIVTWLIIITLFLCVCFFCCRPYIRGIVGAIETAGHTVVVKMVWTPLRFVALALGRVCYMPKELTVGAYRACHEWYYPYLVVS